MVSDVKSLDLFDLEHVTGHGTFANDACQISTILSLKGPTVFLELCFVFYSLVLQVLVLDIPAPPPVSCSSPIREHVRCDAPSSIRLEAVCSPPSLLFLTLPVALTECS